ncbi:MAG: RNA polymerase sigma factor [Thermomicrobiales bacterium]
MGGLPIQMPSLGCTIDKGRQHEQVRIVSWFDDALPRLFGYFLPRVGNNIQIAEDLTQETMLAAVRGRSGDVNVAEVMPWLFGIARHKLVDHYRRHYREADQDTGTIDDIVETSQRLPMLDLQAIHTRDAIISTLDRLPPRQRLAITLRYLDDQPVADVATALDLTLSATESLLARARRTFRADYLTSNGEHP